MAFAFGAEARAFHDFKFFELGTVFQHHVEIRVESASRDHDRLTVNLERFAVPRRRYATDAAVFGQQLVRLWSQS